MKSPFALLALLCVLCATPAYAATPDYLSLGGGIFDFDKPQNSRRAVDYRVEYRWGVSLLPLIDKSFNSVEPFMQLHPSVGFEGNGNGATYPDAGLNLDIPLLWHHAILTWGEALGLWGRGNDPRYLGSALEFRSQVEVGWQFDNGLRATAYISHLSNAHIVKTNPGAEIVGAYLQIPVSDLTK
ncbi:MAG: acyloxyacyl hydrolase [Alphaproteobacteria bacterium]|nr:acyloxyacyl hydrolase [Alphaproteobacteria bacterium]